MIAIDVPSSPRVKNAVHQIVDVVAYFFGVTPAQIYGPRRFTRIATARQAVMYLANQNARFSTCYIGESIGRDHTTVMHGIRATQKAIALDAEVARQFALLAMLMPATRPPPRNRLTLNPKRFLIDRAKLDQLEDPMRIRVLDIEATPAEVADARQAISEFLNKGQNAPAAIAPPEPAVLPPPASTLIQSAEDSRFNICEECRQPLVDGKWEYETDGQGEKICHTCRPPAAPLGRQRLPELEKQRPETARTAPPPAKKRGRPMKSAVISGIHRLLTTPTKGAPKDNKTFPDVDSKRKRGRYVVWKESDPTDRRSAAEWCEIMGKRPGTFNTNMAHARDRGRDHFTTADGVKFFFAQASAGDAASPRPLDDVSDDAD